MGSRIEVVFSSCFHLDCQNVSVIVARNCSSDSACTFHFAWWQEDANGIDPLEADAASTVQYE